MKVQLGNATMRATAELIQECNMKAVPCLLENGATSMLWAAPEIKTQMAEASTITGDYCLHGTPYRKRTRFATWNCSQDFVNASILNKRCSSKKSICDRSGKKHIVLEGPTVGPGPKGWKTSAAQVYPKPVAKASAKIITSGPDHAPMQEI